MKDYYSTTSKAYRVWNFDSGTLEEVHDVEFDETKGFKMRVRTWKMLEAFNFQIA